MTTTDPFNTPQPRRETVLETARQAIGGDRQRDYGDPEPGFTTAGRIIAAVLGVEEVTAEQVALIAIALKISRLKNTPNHADSWVDIAGYAALGGEVASMPGRHI
ncbi:hypothetical protein J3996_gp55 [Mycobacterium phage Laurie]|uniref:DUF6378 domain-containing protein n=1 Tax=Mycobacterium phage Laurie TaxID=1874015 RepID=A0A1B2IHT3_9CAUD|nr:hypothetical protein J3996_gp55 [Mycobacterium phage Laurie]ANZ52349.1 hypothetical protein SEA_LAURIE_55 [Mycobacterium phage Laurie]